MFPFSACRGSHRWACFVLGLLPGVLLWLGLSTPRAAQFRQPPRPHLPPLEKHSLETSRIKAGFPPDPLKDGSNRKSKGPRAEQLRADFEKMKSDATVLAELASSLKADLEKANPNVLPAQLVEKTKLINELAKRIRKASNIF